MEKEGVRKADTLLPFLFPVVALSPETGTPACSAAVFRCRKFLLRRARPFVFRPLFPETEEMVYRPVSVSQTVFRSAADGFMDVFFGPGDRFG